MIAVTFALPRESRDFRRLLTAGNHEIAILHTGVGEKICRQRIEPFLDRQRFDFLISSGFAGGIEPSLGVGELLLAENFSDPKLLARGRDILIARVGKLFSTQDVIESAAERETLQGESGALAVDMESSAIAAACAERELPMLSLRVISDTAAAPFPVPLPVLFDLERQATNARRLAGHLLTHPSAIVRLLRFSRQIAAARAELAAGLATLLRSLR